MNRHSEEKRQALLYPQLGIGMGLRPPHYAYVLENLPPVAWFEVISENFMGLEDGNGGRPIHVLDQVRAHYPVVLHGVSLSIGSVDPLNGTYLKRLKELIRRIEPAWVSDHLCWTGANGQNLHDLLPLPYTEEALRHVVTRVEQVQEYLGRRILLENVSSYLTYRHSEMEEWEFLAEVASQADCGILLDINNVYVSAVNHGFDPRRYLAGVPAGRIGQFHLAGYSDMGDHLLDTHDHPVYEPVWELYREALHRYGARSALVEWDDRIPDFPELEAEVLRARRIEESAVGKRDRSAAVTG